jgi:hypothetical protein
MMLASERQYISLPGLTLPIEPWLLLLDLEARDFSIRRDGDDLIVAPRVRLTGADCAALRRWKAHLLALVDRCEAIQ